MARTVSLERSGFMAAVTVHYPHRLRELHGRPSQPDSHGWLQAEADGRANRAGAQFMNDSLLDDAMFPRLNRS